MKVVSARGRNGIWREGNKNTQKGTSTTSLALPAYDLSRGVGGGNGEARRGSSEKTLVQPKTFFRVKMDAHILEQTMDAPTGTAAAESCFVSREVTVSWTENDNNPVLE